MVRVSNGYELEFAPRGVVVSLLVCGSAVIVVVVGDDRTKPFCLCLVMEGWKDGGAV